MTTRPRPTDAARRAPMWRRTLRSPWILLVAALAILLPLEPRLRQGGYAVWNASLAWTSPQRRWELALRVDNIGDTAYRTTGFAYQTGVVIGYYGPPRSYAMTLGWSF